MIVHPAQHFFIQGLVDYAGLFPPAALSLKDSLQAYRGYQHGLAPSLLGRFVCNVAHLGDLADLLLAQDSFCISALLEAPEEVELVEEFHRRAGAKVRVDTIETRLIGSEQGQRWLRRWHYHLFFEVKPEQFTEGAAFCAARPERLGLKLRTGAIRPEGLPSLAEVVEFLRLAHQARVPYKFTAGLHHACPGTYPLTYAADAPKARLLGFVNLFGLACLYWHGRLDEEALSSALERDGLAVRVDENGLHYDGESCSAAEIEEFRHQGARSFGSCSFEEPLQELIEMGWIC